MKKDDIPILPVYLLSLLNLYHIFSFLKQRCAPASIRLMDNQQFQFGKKEMVILKSAH